jgi:multiple sugar transport system ATP-binding protein
VVDEMAARLTAYENRPVVLGIRPEDLYDKLFVTDAPQDCIMTSVVDLVEPLGAEVYLHLRVGTHTLMARVGPHDRPEVNQDIDLVFDMGKAHFFDPEGEASIV